MKYGLIACAAFLLIVYLETALPKGEPIPTQAEIAATAAVRRASERNLPPPDLANWTLSTSKNEMDDSEQYSLSSGEPESGMIGIRCERGKIDIVIVTKDQIEPEYGGGHTARLKFDSEKPVSQQWSESTNGKGLFSKSPRVMLKQMLRAKVMLYEFTPFQAANRVISFNMDGLSTAFAPMAKAC